MTKGLPAGMYIPCEFFKGMFSSERGINFPDQVNADDPIVTDSSHLYVLDAGTYRQVKQDEESGKGFVRSTVRGNRDSGRILLGVSNNLGHCTTPVSIPLDDLVHVP